MRCLALIPVCAAAVAASPDWPEFRGPGRQGVSLATNVPITWNGTTPDSWNVEVPGAGWSSPSVWPVV